MSRLLIIHLLFIADCVQGFQTQVIDIFPKPQVVGSFGESLSLTTVSTIDVWYSFLYIINGASRFLTQYPTSNSCSERPNQGLSGYSYFCNTTHFVLMINSLTSELTGTKIRGQLTLNNASFHQTSTTEIFVNAFVLFKPIHNAVLGEPYNLTCRADEPRVNFLKNGIPQCILLETSPNGSCTYVNGCDQQNEYFCNPSTNTYVLRLPGSFSITHIHNSIWSCADVFGKNPSDTITLYVDVPISVVNITPTTDDGITQIESGLTRIFTCITDVGRPAPWIHWYISSNNITNLSTAHSYPNGDMASVTSTLVYRGNEADHNKIIYCQAENIEGRLLTSIKQTLYILYSITSVMLRKSINTLTNDIIEGDRENFTCTTDSGRPAANIEWYIGVNNVTANSTTLVMVDNTKFITISVLVYIGNANHHDADIYCKAANIGNKPKIMSNSHRIKILVPVSSVEISPKVKEIKLMEGGTVNFTCKTSPSRPHALLTWFIGSKNVTDSAKHQTIQLANGMSVTTSVLMYTASKKDHGKVIYCTAENIQERQKVKSDIINLEVLCCSSCESNEEQPPSFQAGVGTGAGGMFLFYSLVLIAVILFKEDRIKCKDKSKTYEETRKEASENNPYNELSEIPKGNVQSSSEAEIRATYEEIGTNIKN